MNSNVLKSLKLLALATLVVAGCDPFTKTPTGTPQVIRAISTGSLIQEAPSVASQTNIIVSDVTLDSVLNVWFNVALDPTTVQAAPYTYNPDGTVNNGAAATDEVGSRLTTKTFTPAGGTATNLPRVAASGSITSTNSLAGDTVTINTTTLTAGTDWSVAGGDTAAAAALAAAINANVTLRALVVATADTGVVNLVAVTPGLVGNNITLAVVAVTGSALAASGSSLTGGADTSIAFQPGSAIAGGIIQVILPTYLAVGAYDIGGTVKDTAGNPGTFNATYNVTHIPVFVPTDPYTIDMAWANDPRATGFTVNYQPVLADNSNAAAPNVLAWAPLATGVSYNDPLTTGNNSAYRVAALAPGTGYWFEVLPEGVVPANSAAASTPNLTGTAGQPGLKAVANPLIGTPPTAAPGVVQLAWARMRSASYRVETSADGLTAWTPMIPGGNWTNVSTTPVVGVPANPIPPTSANPFVLQISGVPAGPHSYRIVPVWGSSSATVGVAKTGDGLPTKTATVTVQ